MAPRLSGQTSIFGVVFFVSKSLLGIDGQRKLEKFTILTRKPRSHARILIYRTWPISVLNFLAAITISQYLHAPYILYTLFVTLDRPSRIFASSYIVYLSNRTQVSMG